MTEEKKSITLVVFSGDLDKALAAFNIAVGAASMGMEVSMFFTFWGLNIIKKNEGPIKTKGLKRKMMNIMDRGGSKRLHASKFHMMGIGTGMMKTMMKDIRFPQLEELMALAKQLNVKFIACTTSMGLFGLDKDAFIPGVDSYEGVAAYLGEATQSKVNLFI